ncbi:LuxR C-terminal-related transcriptional regulator [Actinoplanes sp. Pm04-4]|uniref:LuxR C-terminal-related transcriptional regulator n=1 Tax=Paractinoplanes pyxinae TaxID=2997416 RepID=A0ABT4ASB7_9ACTN|nr:LuxR family transcriptional regulator [Actinoplanes pyxinae]MCY1137133.1 LuxR C-terminal-related transcriptional regulator [Actinoplanes pyxinae]
MHQGHTAPLRGREAQLAVADRRMSAVAGGGRGVLLLDGPAGVGKSRLIAELVRRAGPSSVRTLRADAVTGPGAPFAPLLAATLGADPPVGDARTLRALSERPGAAFWVLDGLRSALRAAGPLVIVLDDMHGADADTTAAIRTLAADPALLWVLSGRRAQARPHVRELWAQLERDGAEAMTLSTLGGAASVRVVEDFVRAIARPPLLELAGAAGGNPYWILELLRGLDEEGRLPVAGGTATVTGAGLPRRVATAVGDRVHALSPIARKLVRMAAVLPRRFTTAHLAAMLRAWPADLIEPLDEAVRADLLTVDGRNLRFGHDLLRRGARAALPGSLRRALEREAADVLLRTGDAPAEAAALLARTVLPGDRAAIDTLRAAARTARDPAAASDLLVRTLDVLPPDDEARGPVIVEALVQSHRAARFERTRELAGRARAELLPAEQNAELLLHLSTMADRPAGERAADNRAALALRGTTPRLRGRHHAWLACNLVLDGDLAEADRLARAASTGAGAGLARLVVASVHAARGAGTLASAELDRLLSEPPEPDDPHAGLHGLLTANLLHHLGRTGDATAAFTESLRQARRDHDGPLQGLCTQLSAMAHLMSGRLDESRALALGSAADLAPALRMTTIAALAHYLGDPGLARTAVSLAKQLRTGEGLVERRWATRVLAADAAARADAGTAARLLRDDPLLPAAPPLPTDLAFLTMATRVALTAADAGLLERCTAAAVTLEQGAADAPAFAAAAAQIHGMIAGDAEQLLTAAKLQNAAGRPLLAASAIEDAGGADHLTQALEIYEEAGAAGDAQRVRKSLREQGRRRPARPDSGWASLTTSELKVVRLIATGTTNRRAAEQLSLSPHTVNTHVRHVFTKLGVTSRVQLAHLLRDNGG